VFRVVRPGGHLAVQDLVGDADTASGLQGRRLAPLDARRDAILAAGFVDVAIGTVDDARERSARLVAARAHLQSQLAAAPTLAEVALQRAAVAAALEEGRLRVVQLVGRRP
jgi:hypothetical protein